MKIRRNPERRGRIGTGNFSLANRDSPGREHGKYPADFSGAPVGHWQRGYSDKVTPIIDRFCTVHAKADFRLLAYAQSARCGCVL
ncbi:hypothetical protein [Bradyrhizobium ottawaense]|uniref:hypothetical protein n=1 Tax=Bradyrhizobium ottawaense TaxID=931866 RepID=UPI003F9F9AB5